MRNPAAPMQIGQRRDDKTIWPCVVAKIPGDSATAHADARLIAAAPSMLEALQAQEEASAFAVVVSEATKDGEKIGKALMDKADSMFRRAERLRCAAIALATIPTGAQ